MGERIDRLAATIRQIFVDWSVDIREERVIRYIAGEINKGRSFDEVMTDPYVCNNTDETERARILENPATLKMIEEQFDRLQ